MNTFTLEIDGTPLPEGSEGVLRFALPAQDMGEQELILPQAGPTRFTAEGPELALAGDWAARGAGAQDRRVLLGDPLPLRVADTPPPSPDLNPAPLFGPGGIAGMVGAGDWNHGADGRGIDTDGPTRGGASALRRSAWWRSPPAARSLRGHDCLRGIRAGPRPTCSAGDACTGSGVARDTWPSTTTTDGDARSPRRPPRFPGLAPR